MGKLLGKKVMSFAHLRNHGCPLYNYVANMLAYMLYLYQSRQKWCILSKVFIINFGMMGTTFKW